MLFRLPSCFHRVREGRLNCWRSCEDLLKMPLRGRVMLPSAFRPPRCHFAHRSTVARMPVQKECRQPDWAMSSGRRPDRVRTWITVQQLCNGPETIDVGAPAHSPDGLVHNTVRPPLPQQGARRGFIRCYQGTSPGVFFTESSYDIDGFEGYGGEGCPVGGRSNAM